MYNLSDLYHWARPQASPTFALFWMSQKTKYNNCLSYTKEKKMEVMFLFLHWRQESRTAVIHDVINRDLACPWHDNRIIYSYDITGADFENSLYAFNQSEKS